MRDVPALGRAMKEAAPGKVSLVIIGEPVLGSDLRCPSRSVTRPIDGIDATKLWDPERIASQAALRAARAHRDRVPARFDLGEGAIVWDVVATWPPGAT